MASTKKHPAPLSEVVVTAVARLVGDAQTGMREPSHSDIEFCIERAGLRAGDPKALGQTVGKEKRVRATLTWALEHDPEAGELLVSRLVSQIRGMGGFRPDSPNYVGADCIANAVDVFKGEGYQLAEDGVLMPVVLSSLTSVELTETLKSYVQRAQRGVRDAALLVGTGKDLLEAVAAHVLQERYGVYDTKGNFPTLLGQAFVALGLATSEDPRRPDESPERDMERAMFELGLKVNRLRNKEGTGHGHPWLPTVSESEAKLATEMMGVIGEMLLLAHEGSLKR